MKRVRVLFGKTKPHAGVPNPDDGVAKPNAKPPTQNELAWRAWDGGIAHPDSPDGGGGPGGFGSGILGRDAPNAGSPPHPRAPRAWFRLAAVPDAGVPPQGGAPSKAVPAPDAGTPKVNPPPLLENDLNIPTVKLNGNKTIDVELRGTIQADAPEKNKPGTAAHTSLRIKKDLELGAEHQNEKITLIKSSPNAKKAGLPRAVLTFFIQTRYEKDADPAGPSAYGRGTTKEDKKMGNISLSFHESCHRDDLKDYVRIFKSFVGMHPFPEFKVRVGMSLEDFRKEKKNFLAPEDSADEGELDKFVSGLHDQITKETSDKTDEVGYKLSEYCHDHPDDGECVTKGE
jgi:hypothetical protein